VGIGFLRVYCCVLDYAHQAAWCGEISDLEYDGNVGLDLSHGVDVVKLVLFLTLFLFAIPPAQAAQGKTYYYVQGDIASEMPSKAICEARLREHFVFDKKIRGAKVYIEDPWPPRCLKYLPPRFFGARKWKSR
jgi:hypothetical protein